MIQKFGINNELRVRRNNWILKLYLWIDHWSFMLWIWTVFDPVNRMPLLKFNSYGVNHCPILNENLKDFDKMQIPTKKDALLCCLEVWRKVGLVSESYKEPASSSIARQVAFKLDVIWDETSIPAVKYNRMIQLITRYHAE